MADLAARGTGVPANVRLLFLPLAALALAAGLAPVTNNDIWLHLATGRWMVEGGRLPGPEVFSFVAAGRPYLAHEWGSELIFFALHAMGGILALVLFKGVAALLLAWAAMAAGRSRGAGEAQAAAAAGLAIFLAAAHLWIRPHLFTWGAALATVALLRAARRRPLWLLALPVLQVLWTNLHGGFVLGPALALAWTAGEGVRRLQGRGDARPAPVLAATVAMGAVTVINPYGTALLHLPFELTRSDLFMGAIFEWQPPFTSAYAGTYMFAEFLLCVGLLGVGWLRRWRQADAADVAVLLLALALALRMNRNVPLFALLAAGPLSRAWSAERGSATARISGIAVASVLLLAALVVATVGYPYGPDQFRPRGLGVGPDVPVSTCEYVADKKISGSAFTTYGEGAYVVWRLWPQVRVGMDSRNSVYGEELYREYREALLSDAGLRRYMDRRKPDLAIVGHQGPFRRGLDVSIDLDRDLPHRGFIDSGEMVLVDFDDISAVYLRTTGADAALAEEDAYRVIHPVLLPAVFDRADIATAVAEARRAASRHPQALVPRWILAQAYAQAGRHDEALAELDTLAGLRHRLPRRWGIGRSMEAARLGLVGFLLLQRGDCTAARRALEQAIAADPGYSPAIDLLRSLDC